MKNEASYGKQAEFQREYLSHVPLPLAQLYNRIYSAKDARSRHDNAFYLFEALIKLTASVLIAAYLHEVRRSGERDAKLVRVLEPLALPSLGHWLAILRSLAEHFHDQTGDEAHVLAGVWIQLNRQHKHSPGLLDLYRCIKNGPDAEAVNDRSCSLLQVFDVLVQYRNTVFGHGANRSEAFYDQQMGPLLLPAVNEVLAGDILALLGVRDAHLIYLTDIRLVSESILEVSFRNLTGNLGEPAQPLRLDRTQAQELAPQCVAVRFPQWSEPLRLDPLMIYVESDLASEVLFLNRERNGKRVEYLSYTTGKVLPDQNMVPAMSKLLSTVTGHSVTPEDISSWADRSHSEAPPVVTEGKGESGFLQLGDYEILAEIGHGGMGVVYLARQLSLGRLVALKMLPEEMVGDEVAMTRFQREMRVLASCEHPNIVRVFASGRLPNGRIYYAMEYVPGADLEHVWHELAEQAGKAPVAHLSDSAFMRALLSAAGKSRRVAESRYQNASGSGGRLHLLSMPATNEDAAEQAPGIQVPKLPLPPLPAMPSAKENPESYIRHVVTLVRDAALALQTVHDKQVIHRDIKPANLMLTADGSRIVLMDFGLVKGTDPTMTASLHSGLLGTMRYAAPEQLAAASIKVGPAADVRGLGVTLWEMLTRKRLFAEAADEKQLAMMIHETDIPSLRSIDPGFDRDLDAIVTRATERRIKDRIPTAGKLAEYLQMYLDRQPLPIRPLSKTERIVRWVQRRKEVMVSTLAVLLLFGAVIGVLLYWDENYRLQESYYAAATKRWGKPEGIGKISLGEIKYRHSTLEFTTQGKKSDAQIKQVKIINSHGKCPTIHENSTIELNQRFDLSGNYSSNFYSKVDFTICSWNFDYDDKGNIISERAYDRNQQLLYEFKYTFLHDSGCFSENERSKAQSKNGVPCYKIEYYKEQPYNGLIRKVVFLDKNANPRSDGEGIFGVGNEFTENGRLKKQEMLNRHSDKIKGKSGFEGIQFSYKENKLESLEFNGVAFFDNGEMMGDYDASSCINESDIEDSMINKKSDYGYLIDDKKGIRAKSSSCKDKKSSNNTAVTEKISSEFLGFSK